MMNTWIQWLIASFSAGVGGVFAMLTYIHGNFVSIDEMQTHVSQPHRFTVSVDRYNQDIRYIREQITEINRKLDNR